MRRSLIALSLLAACGDNSTSGPPPLPVIAELPAFTDINPDPHVIEVNLSAAETEVELTPGYMTKVLAYNGITPGPLLQAHVGDRVIVHFTNNLAKDTTIHWHGLRISSDMDGNPMIQDPIPPGGTFDYDFVLPEAGTFWFHPHANTIEQIDRGLYGAIVVAEDDAPVFTAERVMVIDDIRLDANKQISPFNYSGHDVMMGRLGNTLLVNGSTEPVTANVPLRSVERWHLLAASTARVFDVGVVGASWRVIGTDGGLLPTPYTTDRITMAPGQRYDLEVVYDQGVSSVQLDVYAENDQGVVQALPVADFAISGDANAELPVYPVVTLPEMPAAPIEKEIRLGANNDGFTINGMVGGGENMPVEQYAQNVPVVFTIVNDIGPYHPFHLHGQFFQILERDGQPANEPGLKDTVLLDSFQTVKVMTYFENPGMWMYHCHIPEHAENGMMAELEVVPQ
jgi:FtsP/CotA-like multicopper oxidase with cupredoxin domain